MYGAPGTGLEASGGFRRSKIGVLGSQGVRGGVRGPISGLPYPAPVAPLGLDPHLYRADALVGIMDPQDPLGMQ